MSVNRVWLVGNVMAPPRTADAVTALFLVGTTRWARGRTVVDRHLVRAPVSAVTGVQTGSLVLVHGMLTVNERRRRHIVMARRVTVLTEPEVREGRAGTAGTHASPAPHDRTGHFRKVGAGTPRERLIWVRPTTVGRAGADPSGRNSRA